MFSRLRVVQARLQSANKTLHNLQIQSGHSLVYFENQWADQRCTQLETISVNAAQQRDRLIILMDLEEKLIEARLVHEFTSSSASTYKPLIYCLCLSRDSIRSLDVARAHPRTQAQTQELLNLPQTLNDLEHQIQSTADALGSREFLELTGTSGD